MSDAGDLERRIETGIDRADGRSREASLAYVEELQLLEQPLATPQPNPPDPVQLGDRARDARNWPEAAQRYREALALDPGLTPIWVQLGHALKEQGNHIEAEGAYRRALALDESVADTYVQLGHVLKLRGRHAQAIECYADAVRLDPHLRSARESLEASLGYAKAEIERAIEARRIRLPVALAERYGALIAEAGRSAGAGFDVIWFGGIDWNYRIQRPQHLAAHLADAGCRIVYVSLAFEPADELGRFRIIDMPHPGVFEVRLRIVGDACETIYRGLSFSAVVELQQALDELIAVLGIRAPVLLIEHPGWYPVASGMPGGTVVYDCLDLVTGFSATPQRLADLEAALIAEADAMVAASAPLAEHFADRRQSAVIRNGADIAFFARGYTERMAGERPVIGYFGAIADWFEIDWLEYCAAARPDWEFRLIGRADNPDCARLAGLPNVSLCGEAPYEKLPQLLRGFDVAVIPFRICDLTRCTNPVKLYEYMAAGKAVVASPMPEIGEAGDLVYIAEDAAAFAARIAEALAEDSVPRRRRRQEWAAGHGWAERAGRLLGAIEPAFPLVSVVILAGSDWAETNACLFAVRNRSDYPRLEIVAVASDERVGERLRAAAAHDPRLRVAATGETGFAAAANAGIAAAAGDYVILLRGDAVVTDGWVRDLIRPMLRDPTVGLTGPLTNGGDNEQRVRTPYRGLAEMPAWARGFVRTRSRRGFETGSLSFFCVAIRRAVLDRVGLLDEAYELGYFDADDYCRRARQADYAALVVENAFVYQDKALSLHRLQSQTASRTAHERALFEKRWGWWEPHYPRNEAGFG